jgi:archaellum component FlaC
MDMPFAHVPQRIDATWLPALADAARGSTFAWESHIFPEAENPMLEHILRGIDQRLGSIDKRLDTMDQRFDKMDQRFDRMDERFDRMDERFDRMDERLDRMDERFDKMDERFDRMDERFDKVDERFLTMDQRFCVLTADVAGLNTAVSGLGTRIARVEAAQDNFTLAVRDFSASLARTQAFIDGPHGITLISKRTEELISQMSVLSYRIQTMPSWKFLGVAAAGTVASAAGSVTWLMQGGARALSHWFE